MNHELITNEFLSSVDVDKIQGSLLVLARKRIILPEKQLFADKREVPSLLQNQTDDDNENRKIYDGIILFR